MPPLVPPGIVTGQLNYVDLAVEAVIARLSADPNLMVGGNLGVATIEREYPQPNDEPRTYPRAGLPALSVSGSIEDSDYIAMGTRDLPVEVRVRCVTESGSTRTAEELANRILENVRFFLLEEVKNYPGTFLGDLGAGVGENGSGPVSDVRQVDGTPFRFYGDFTLRIQIVHNAPTGGPN